MLENRSFDHLLGFLDHPDADYPGLRGASYPNPHDVTDRASPTVDASDDAEHLLRLDPPHGHLSAKLQMNGTGWRRFRMNGFVAAYAEKLSGNEAVPRVHFWRIGIVLFLLSPLAAAAVGATWAALLWCAAAVAVVATVVWGMRLPRVLQKPPRALVVPVLVGGGVLGALGCGGWRLATGHGTNAFVTAFLWMAIVVLVLRFRNSVKRRNRARVGASGLAERSAQVMRCMHPDRIPVMAELARRFAVCTAWFSSVPGATWPNRNFAHAATSEETVDIEIGLYDATTVFELLEREGATWHIYHDGMAQAMAFGRLWDGNRADNWFGMDAFHEHAAAGRLPNYSFVEPRHDGELSNSQHPGNNQAKTSGSTDFARGEALVRDVYETLRATPGLFDKTLLLVTYDEHGGLFDHVPPPRARHPELLRYGRKGGPYRLSRRIVAFFVETPHAPFDFRCMGPRVPAVAVSPWIAAGSIDTTRYDHSSIVATVRELFAPGQPPLTRRDKAANSLLHLVVGDAPPRPMPPPPAATAPLTAAAAPSPPPPPPPPPPTTVTMAADLEDQLAALAPHVDPRLYR